MGPKKQTGERKGRGRPRKNTAGTSTQTTEGSPPQPLADADPDPINLEPANAEPAPIPVNTGTPTQRTVDPKLRRSPRFNKVPSGSGTAEPTEQVVDAEAVPVKTRKAAETGASLSNAEKGKAAKRNKTQIKTEGTSSGNTDPAAYYRNLYNAEQEKVQQLATENQKLTSDNEELNAQLSVVIKKLQVYEPPEDTAEATAGATDAQVLAEQVDEPTPPVANQDTPAADDGPSDSA